MRREEEMPFQAAITPLFRYVEGSEGGHKSRPAAFDWRHLPGFGVARIEQGREQARRAKPLLQ